MADDVSLGEAARAIGVSADTLRRWERAGKLRTRRDAAEELALAPGVPATATVKATSVMVERGA